MKRELLRTFLFVAACGLGLTLVISSGFYSQVARPNWEMGLLLFVQANDKDEAAVFADFRRVSNRVISHPWGNHHDAFINLIECGDATSVPCLIRAMRWQDLPRDEHDSVICTTGHCFEALQKITGQNFGFDAALWEQWWRENKSQFLAAAPSERFSLTVNRTMFLYDVLFTVLLAAGMMVWLRLCWLLVRMNRLTVSVPEIIVEGKRLLLVTLSIWVWGILVVRIFHIDLKLHMTGDEKSLGAILLKELNKETVSMALFAIYYLAALMLNSPFAPPRWRVKLFWWLQGCATLAVLLVGGMNSEFFILAAAQLGFMLLWFWSYRDQLKIYNSSR